MSKPIPKWPFHAVCFPTMLVITAVMCATMEEGWLLYGGAACNGALFSALANWLHERANRCAS